MATHGNAPTSAQYAEFSGIVQSRLWPAIKNRLSGEEIQALITGNGPEEVLRRLRKALTVGKTENAPVSSLCPFFANEEVPSDGGYPPEYAVKSIAEQLVIFGKYFPNFDPSSALAYSKNLPERPEGAEGPFVIPNWLNVSREYGEAAEKMCALLASTLLYGKKTSRGAFDLKRLQQSHRTWEAEHLIYPGIGSPHLPGNDYIVLWAQFGFLHRGRSTRRVRSLYAPNEFGLGAFAVTSMLLTHSERFSSQSVPLDIICPGDEYSNNYGDLCYVPRFSRRGGSNDLDSMEFHGISDKDFGPATAFLPAEAVA
ncbi:MAG: hypothetical protein HYT29_02140 [Parcubacteria group bacterium]|nr:hypothetical protein [Parcubacteria group bacterium]